MPGSWEALILNDASTDRDDDDVNNEQSPARSLRISLRHKSCASPSSPLESYHTGQETAPSGIVVSLVHPSINRISSFIKQGVFTDDEIDYSVEGEERVTNDSFFLGCLSLVTFDGFTSSSESVNDAVDVSNAMLACCPRRDDDQGVVKNHEELCKIVDDDNDVTGILFPCKIDFDYEYFCLISHDDKFRVTAVDGEKVLSYPIFSVAFASAH